MLKVSTNYLTFRIGHEWYGINVEPIIEVIHMVGLTELPGTPPEILGLLTLRDRVMPVIDLRLRLGNAADVAPLRLDTPIIAVTTPYGAMGLVVDDVDDVEVIEEIADYENDESPYVNAVARLEDRLLLLLDTAFMRSQIKVKDEARV